MRIVNFLDANYKVEGDIRREVNRASIRMDL
jgi:hypothetical protein